MKKLIFFLLLVCGISHAGIVNSGRVDTSSHNLATTFATTAYAEVAVGVSGAKIVCVHNATTSDMAGNVDTYSSTSAPSVNVNDFYILAGMSRCLPVRPRVPLNLYLRSDSGSTITTGIFRWEFMDIDTSTAP